MHYIQFPKRTHKWTAQWLFGLSVLFFYDTYLDLFLSLLHSLWVLLHLLFETFEHLLDNLVEHIFHTSPRATQIIVFYIMALSFGCIAFVVLRAVPRWYCSACERFANYYEAKKTTLLSWWQQQALILKVKWVSLLMASSFLMMFMAFS